MVLFIILGVVVSMDFVLLGVLFFLLNKEEQKKEEKVFPVEEVYKKRVRELEEELLAVSKKTDEQSTQASRMIETLTKENGSLKSRQAGLEQAQEKLIELQGEASGLKTENAGLKTQLESTISLKAQLESTNEKVRLLEEEISRANATLSELNREKEALLSAPKTGPDEALRHELESLKYEMIKARAQSSGLERISFNYKNQLEDFLKKVNAMQVSKDHLSQDKNRLEGMAQEIKMQNEQLLKKDQLAQFELEKNRSRLVSLEREYEDFKARAQQKGQ